MKTKALLFYLILTVAALSRPAWAGSRWGVDLGLNFGICGGVSAPTVPQTFDFWLCDAVAGLDGSLQYRLTPDEYDPLTRKGYEPLSWDALGLRIGRLWAVSDLKYSVLYEAGWNYGTTNWVTSYVPVTLFYRGMEKGKYIQFGLEYYTFRAAAKENAYRYDNTGWQLESRKVQAKTWGDGWGVSLTIGAEQTEPSPVRAGIALTGRLAFPRERGHAPSEPVYWKQTVKANLTGLFLSLRFKPNFL